MIVYLIRHGETDYNSVKKLQGHSDICLNEKGRSLAEKVAQAMESVEFDLIFSSPLKRALETARILKGNRDIPIIQDERIKEICFGEYEGLSYQSGGFNIPDNNFLDFFNRPDEYNTPPGGESFEDILSRTKDFLKELSTHSQYKNKTILISTHGCALKAILANIKKTPLRDFWGEGVDRNCAVTIVEITNENVNIIAEGKVMA